MNQVCRVLLVDDERSPREAFAHLIALNSGYSVCGTADGAASAMQLLDSTQPDIVITDLAMPGPDGIQLTKAVRSFRPGVRVLILSSHDESLFAERALLAGASGYLMKVNAPALIGNALDIVREGSVYLSSSMWHQLYRPPDTTALSEEELALLHHIGIGNPPNHALAKALGAPLGHIEQAGHNLMRKLGFIGATELRLYAARLAHS